MALKWPIMCWCAVEKLLTHSLTRIQLYTGKSYGSVVSIISLYSQYTDDGIITSIYTELIWSIMFSGVSAAWQRSVFNWSNATCFLLPPIDFISNPFLGQLSKRVSYLCKVPDDLSKVRKQTYHFSDMLIIYPTNLTCGKAKLHLVRFNVILNLLISDKLF